MPQNTASIQTASPSRGASAGAHLAAMTAFTGDDLDFSQPGIEHAEQSDRAQAFVGWTTRTT